MKNNVHNRAICEDIIVDRHIFENARLDGDLSADVHPSVSVNLIITFHKVVLFKSVSRS